MAAEFNSHYSSLQCHMFLQKLFFYADLVLKKHFKIVYQNVKIGLVFLWKLFFSVYFEYIVQKNSINLNILVCFFGTE